tara:strand:+ start:3934 stop:4941 length:1008 start_codon:yes stop_codon:yes gene_type:complete
MHLRNDIANFNDVSVYSFEKEQVLPLVLKADIPNIKLQQWASEYTEKLNSLLSQFGAILFRGFDLKGSEDFNQVIDVISGNALAYKERSSPRSTVSGNIYTSTDHPEDKAIFLHTEQSYNVKFPSKIFFYCDKTPEQGGETPIADTRRIYKHLVDEALPLFEDKKYQYSRYFWPMMGMNWQKAFQTDSKAEVEQYCLDNEIQFKWNGDDELQTYQIRPLVAEHPNSGDLCWFNHCTFFNIYTLDADVQEIFMESFDMHELPNNTLKSDGSEIPQSVIKKMQHAYNTELRKFSWLKGDMLMLDNMLCAHGRSPFQGERKILVGMAELIEWNDVEVI